MKKLFTVCCLFSSAVFANSYDWKGCYLGTHSSYSDTTSYLFLSTNNEVAYHGPEKDYHHSFLGFNAGCDYFENSKWVLGSKVSYFNNQIFSYQSVNGFDNHESHISNSSDNLFSFSQTFGYKLSEKSLIYAQLGLLMSRNRVSYFNFTSDDATSSPLIIKDTDTSLIYGLGYERKLSEKLTLFFEYNYSSPRSRRYALNNAEMGMFDDFFIDQNTSLFSLGIRYRF